MDPELQPETPPVDPAVVANATPEPPPAPESEVTPEPTPEPVQEHGNKGKKPWFLERISEESEARRREKERADNLQAMLDRLSNGNPDPATQTHRQPAQPDDAALEARAQQLLAQRQIQSVRDAGLAKYSDWESRAEILGHAGAASPEFVSDVLGVAPSNAHEILAQLADDPARAARLAKMDTRARTIELVKMSMASSQPTPAPVQAAPKNVSKAPAPPPAVEPSTAQVVDWRSDKASDQDFSKGWDAMMAERAKRGRR